MKNLFNQILMLTIIMVYCYNSVHAQNEEKYNFIGLNPSLTVEPFYEEGELDINIFPLVYQRPLTKIIDIRLNSIVNLGIRNDENKISHLGLELALPIFLKPKEVIKTSSKGFFLAPILSYSRNMIEQHNNVGFWIEPGYNLLFDDNFAMTFGLQIGGTYFAYDNGETNWGNHFGIKIIIGKWF